MNLFSDLLQDIGPMPVSGGGAPVPKAAPSLSGLLDDLTSDIRPPPPVETSSPFFASGRRGFSRFKQGAAGVAADLGVMAPESAAQTIAEQERYQQSIPAPPETQEAMRQMSEAQSVSDFLGGLIKSPGALFSIMGESIGQAGPGMAAALPAALGGPLAFGAAAGVTSGATEYASSVLDALREAGIKLDDAQSVTSGLSDPEMMAKAREHAVKRGVPVGLFDGLTAGFAGKILRMAGGPKSTARFVGRAAGEAGMQATGGAAGEAGAQLVSEGQIKRPGEVALEAIAEIPTGVVETAVGSSRQQPSVPGAEPGQAPLVPADELVERAHAAVAPQPAPISAPPVEPAETPIPMPDKSGTQMPDLSAAPVAPDPSAAPVEMPAAPPPALPAQDDMGAITERLRALVSDLDAPSAAPDPVAAAVAQLEPGKPVTNRYIAQAAGKEANLDQVKASLAQQGLIEQKGKAWVRAANPQAPAPVAPAAPVSPANQDRATPPGVSAEAEPISLTGAELGEHADIRSLRDAATRYFEDNLQGRSVNNADLGKPISFDKKGKKKTIFGAGEDLLRAIPALPQLLERGKKISSEPEADPRSDVKVWHKLKASADVGGQRRDLIMTVREMRDGTFHYALNKDRDAVAGPRDSEIPEGGSSFERTAPNALESRPGDDLNIEVGSNFDNPTSERRADTPSKTEGETVSWQVAPDLKAEYRVSPEWTAKRSQAAEAMVEIARQMAPNKKLAVNVADKLTGGTGENRGAVLGAYNERSLESIVSLAMQDQDGKSRGTRDLIKTLNHEIVHFFKQSGLFTQEEWNILKAAARGWMQKYNIGERYSDLSREQQIEEAIAEARAAYSVGDLKVAPGIRRLFDRIAQFLSRVKNWMQGNGFKSWQDVMEAVGSGEIGSREQGRSGRSDSSMHAAWHGSPHDFEEFSLHKIGSGEGNQAYGWGLYFAGNKKVAEYYRDNVSDDAYLAAVNKRLTDLSREMDKYRAGEYGKFNDPRGYEVKAEYDRLMEERAGKKGRLYQVDLAPAEDEYLDWDGPQSDKVGDRLRAAFAGANMPHRAMQSAEGRMIYRELTGWLGDELGIGRSPKAASEWLAKAGIPGIRYLDGSSRDKGDGPRNYVIFDDKLVKVTAKFQRAQERWSDTLNAERNVSVTPAQMDQARGSLFQRAEQKKGSSQQEEIISRIMGSTDKPFGQKLREFFAHWKENIGREFRQGVFDQYDAIAEAEKSLNQGKLLSAEVSAYKRARMLNSGGVIHTLMTSGMVQWKDGRWQKREGFEGGFNAIFEPLAKKGLLRLWQGWAIANRSKRLIQEGRESLLSQSDIDELLKLGEQYPEFREVQRKWARFNSAVLDMAEQSGLVSKDARAVFEKDDYVPFFRILEGEEVTPRGKRGLAGQRAGIKKLEGGEEQINDLMMNMVRNVSHLVDASMKNMAAQSAAELGVKVGALDRRGVVDAEPDVPSDVPDADKKGYADILKTRPSKDRSGFTVMYDGKPVSFTANDPFFLRSMTAIHWPGFNDGMMKIFGGAKNLLTRTVTVFPDFMLANAMRDSLASWVVTGGRTNPWKAAKGFVDSLKDSTSAQALREGGADAVGFYGTDPIGKARELNRLDEGKAARNALRSWWEKWEAVGKASDNANRLALYDRLIKEGASPAEAAYQAMDLMDFSMRGDMTALRYLTAVVPFLNARLQGLYKLGRSANETPRSFLFRGSLIMGASLALMLSNMGDPDYEKIPDQEKDNNYHIKIGDTWFKFPKPFEVGAVFSTVPERLTRWALGQDDSQRLRKRMLRVFADQLSLDPTPQLVKPILEQAMNKVGFTGQTIETEAMRNLRPGERVSDQTSGLAKSLGALAPEVVSPVRVDAALRGYFGTLATYLMGASNVVHDAVTPGERAARRIEDTPVIGRFMRQASGRSSQYMTDFYDLQTEIRQIAGSVRSLQKLGRTEEARELAKDNPGILQQARMADRTSDQIAQIRQRIRQIQADTKMDGAKKRSEIDQLTDRMSAIAQQGYTRLKTSREGSLRSASR